MGLDWDYAGGLDWDYNISGGGGGGGIPEAPNDGKQYGRQNQTWTEVSATHNRYSVWDFTGSYSGNIPDSASLPASTFSLLTGDSQATSPRPGDIAYVTHSSGLKYSYTVTGVSGTNILVTRTDENNFVLWYSTVVYPASQFPNAAGSITVSQIDIKLLFGDRSLNEPRANDTIRLSFDNAGVTTDYLFKIKNVSSANVDAVPYGNQSGGGGTPLVISPDDKFLMDLPADAVIPTDVTMHYQGFGGVASGIELTIETTGETTDWNHVDDIAFLATNWSPSNVHVTASATSAYDGVSKEYSVYFIAGMAGAGTPSAQKIWTFDNPYTVDSTTGIDIDFNDPATYESLTTINTWWTTVGKPGIDPSDPQVIAVIAPDDWSTATPFVFDDVLRWGTSIKCYTNSFDLLIREGLIWDGHFSGKPGISRTDNLGGALTVDSVVDTFSVTSNKNSYYQDVATGYSETVELWQDSFQSWQQANPTSIAEISDNCSVLRAILNLNEDLDATLIWSGYQSKTLVIENNTTSARTASIHFADPEMDVLNVALTAGQKIVYAGCRDGWVKSSGGGIPEAPTDGQLYGRKNSAWEAITSGSGSKIIGIVDFAYTKSTVWKQSSISMLPSGTGYTVGDVLFIDTPDDKTYRKAWGIVQTVDGSGGVISFSSGYNVGGLYSQNINGSYNLVGGTGTGATCNLTTTNNANAVLTLSNLSVSAADGDFAIVTRNEMSNGETWLFQYTTSGTTNWRPYCLLEGVSSSTPTPVASGSFLGVVDYAYTIITTNKAINVLPTANGTGYTVGDVLMVDTPVAQTTEPIWVVVKTVDSNGWITGYEFYGGVFNQAQSGLFHTTGGTGTGADFNILTAVSIYNFTKLSDLSSPAQGDTALVLINEIYHDESWMFIYTGDLTATPPIPMHWEPLYCVETGGSAAAAVAHNNTLSGDGSTTSPLEVNRRYVYGQNDTGNVLYGVGIVLSNGTISENGGNFRLDCPNGDVYTRVSGTTALRKLAHQDEVVLLTGAQSVAGTKTFTSVPVTAVAPTADDHIVNKKYVDNVARYIGVFNGQSGVIPFGNSISIDIPDGIGIAERALIEIYNIGAPSLQGEMAITPYNNYGETTPYMFHADKPQTSTTPAEYLSDWLPLNNFYVAFTDLWSGTASQRVDVHLSSDTNGDEWSCIVNLVFTESITAERRVSWHIELIRN